MIRVRFAPSPTGYLHIGSARTALFNWVYARRYGGTFLLRVEDTDMKRSEARFLDEILADLHWLGITWDEEPVRQSTRFDAYRDAAARIVEAGKGNREGEALLFRVEKGRTVSFDDMIHGPVTFNTDDIKDQVMIKSDGSPAYNFCCVVDDAYQRITHIIRGDDHLSNTPKQILFYEAMGLTPPCFGHMPLILGPDGAKLSKRHGGVAVEEYKREGFLPEALVNYLLLLGWSPGGDRELITLDEAVKLFDEKGMNNVQAKFDIQKLRWMNGEYIAKKTPAELLPLIKARLTEAGTPAVPEEKLLKLIGLYTIRMKTISEFLPMTDCFFGDAYTVDEKGKAKHLDKPESREILKRFAARLETLDDFSHTALEAACRAMADEEKIKAGQIIHPTRVAISGKTAGAGLFEMMEVLGKETALERMRKAAA